MNSQVTAQKKLFILDTLPHWSRLRFTTDTDDNVIETEVLAYGPISWAADVGGYLGLLLGASVVSIYDEVVRFTRFLQSFSFPSRSQK